jgi:hypothetical protein
VHLEHGESVSLSHGWLLLLAIKGGQKSPCEEKTLSNLHKAIFNGGFYFIVSKIAMSSKIF